MSDIFHSIPLRHDILMTVKSSPFPMVNRPNVYGLARWRSLGKLQPAVPRPTKAARQPSPRHPMSHHDIWNQRRGWPYPTMETYSKPSFDRGTCTYIYNIHIYIYICMYLYIYRIYIYIYYPHKKKKNIPVYYFYWYLQCFFAYFGGFIFNVFVNKFGHSFEGEYHIYIYIYII